MGVAERFEVNISMTQISENTVFLITGFELNELY